jgi:signal peptidase II
MKAVSAGRLVLFFSLVLGGLAADLATKSWIFGRLGWSGPTETRWLVEGIFGFTTSLNEGALFGIGQGRGAVLTALSIVATTSILVWLFIAGAARDRLLVIALGLVTGGILGNLFDRLGLPGLRWGGDLTHEPGERVYAVRDWIHFKIDGVVDWPIFNIADSLLVCGALLLVWHALFVDRRSAISASSEQSPPTESVG